MAQTPNYQRLGWDSNFFGFNVAHAEFPQGYQQDVRSVIEKAVSDNVHLLTIKGPSDFKLKCEYQSFHVDSPVAYEIDYTQSFPWKDSSPTSLVTYNGHEQRLTVDDLSIIAGQQSRYYRDPNFPAHLADALYKAWVDRAISETETQHIHVAKNDEGQIGGLLVSRLLDLPGRRVGNPALLSVLPSWRGHNLTRGFCKASHTWFRSKGITNGYVVTQGHNHVARRIYEGLGWQMTSQSSLHHVWLNTPPTR